MRKWPYIFSSLELASSLIALVCAIKRDEHGFILSMAFAGVFGALAIGSVVFGGNHEDQKKIT